MHTRRMIFLLRYPHHRTFLCSFPIFFPRDSLPTPVQDSMPILLFNTSFSFRFLPPYSKNLAVNMKIKTLSDLNSNSLSSDRTFSMPSDLTTGTTDVFNVTGTARGDYAKIASNKGEGIDIATSATESVQSLQNEPCQSVAACKKISAVISASKEGLV